MCSTRTLSFCRSAQLPPPRRRSAPPALTPRAVRGGTGRLPLGVSSPWVTGAGAVFSSADAFPRIVPLRPMEAMPGQPAPHLQCPLYRPDSSSFAASLRELEKVTGNVVGWVGGGSQKEKSAGLGFRFGDRSSFSQT